MGQNYYDFDVFRKKFRLQYGLAIYRSKNSVEKMN